MMPTVTRHSSVALGVVALALLATLALSAEAQGPNSLPDERRALFDENQAQRESLQNEQREGRGVFRAGSSTPTDIRDVRAEQGSQQRALFEENGVERREFRSNADMRLRQVMEHFLARTIVHMNQLAVRLGEVGVKIETRISKLEAQNIDVSFAQIKLGEANGALASAQGEIATLESLLTTTLSSEDPSLSRKEIKTAMERARTSLITTRQLYVAVVVELKRATSVIREESEYATSSAPATE